MRFSFLGTASVALGALSGLGPVAAQSQQAFPTAPVRIVVPYTAGGPGDVLARALGDALSQRWKQPVIIDNRPGADEMLGADAVAKAPRDGHTLFLGTDQALVLNSFLHAKVPYDVEADFVPVSRVSVANLFLAVPVTSAVKTAAEFVAKARAEPGTMTYGWTGVSRFAMVQFAQVAGISVNYVGYKGFSALLPDLIAGRLDSSMAVQAGVLGMVKEGKLRALAVTGPKRSSALPDVPTFAEAGYPGFNMAINFGLVAPARTPLAVVDKIAADVREVMRNPDLETKTLVPLGLNVVDDSPAKFAAFLREERKAAAEGAKQAEIRPE